MHYFLFRRLHHSYILVSLAIGLILGVVISFFCNFWLFSSPIWLIVASTLLIVNFCLPHTLYLILSLFAGLILGSFRTSLDLVDRDYIAQFVDQTVVVTGTLYEDPETAGGSTTFRINNLVFGNDSHQKIVAGSIFVKFYGHKPLERSYQVTLTGKLSSGFGSFAGAMYAPTIDKISAPDLPDIALQYRNAFADLIKRFISEPEVDLSLGYLLGQRRALPATLLETLKIVGLTHIIVASGYNLSVLVRLTRRIFKKVSRFAALFFGLLLVVVFIGVTGFTPSMSRAGLVAILSLLAWFFGRKFHPAKLLLLVAAFTLMLNPIYIQDLGWLLSFASFAGVMLLAPLLTAYFYNTSGTSQPVGDDVARPSPSPPVGRSGDGYPDVPSSSFQTHSPQIGRPFGNFQFPKSKINKSQKPRFLAFIKTSFLFQSFFSKRKIEKKKRVQEGMWARMRAKFGVDKKTDSPNFVAQIIIETIAAQLCCLPLLLYFFGTFSIVSLIANILILPTIPLVMALTFATGVTAFLPFIASISGWLATQLLSYHIAVIEFFGNLPWALVAIPPENPLTLLLYPILLLVTIYIWRKTNYRLINVNVIE